MNVYTVSLTTTNEKGSDTETKTLNVSNLITENIISLVGPQWRYIDFNTSQEFNFTTPYGVLTSHWLINGIETNFTGLNMSYTFDQPGRNYNVSVWAETTEGNSSMLEYRVSVGREVAKEHIVPFNNSNYYNLMNATGDLDMDGIMKWSFAPFTDSMGRMAYCIIFIIPFIYLWFNTGRLTLPTTLSLIVGCVFIGYVPAQFTTFIVLVIVMAYAAAFYRLSRGT
jgi:PKD repeat protein